MEKRQEFLWVYILKPNYGLVHDSRKGEFSRAQEMGRKSYFNANRWICPLARVNKPGTNSVLFQIFFVFVSLNKNLSFGVFKIKMVQSHKNTVNTKPFGFEFKF